MKIRILTDFHIHKNQPCPLGSEIEVDDLAGSHLIALGFAEAVKGRKDKAENEHT